MNQKTLKGTIVALALLLIAALFYIFQLKNQVNNSTESIKDFEQEKVSLQMDIDSLDAELSYLEQINVKQDSTLQATYLELESKSSELKRLLANSNVSAKEIRSLKSQIKSLKSEVSRFKREVEKLQAENQELRLANDTLNIQNYQINDTLQTVKTEYADVKTKYEEDKSKIVNTLSTSNFKITPLKVRKSGKEVVKDRASRVNKLKASFKLDPNAKANSENKTLYIRIIKPNGAVANFENGSKGSFTDKNGRTVEYSDKLTVGYNNATGNPIEFDWDYNDFVPGNYRIAVYQNGFKIGEANENLK